MLLIIFLLHRIYAEIFSTNKASARVLEKAGYTFEGIRKTSAIKDGVILDQLIFASIKTGIRTG